MFRCLPSWSLAFAVCVWSAMPGALSAQGADSARTALRDTTGRGPRPRTAPALPSRFTPPLTPRRAFLYSSMLPGLGQSRLDRGSSGALFAAVELSALVMLRRSNADLREARQLRTDTLPGNFTVSGDTLVRSGTYTTRYDGALIRTRRLHLEDWLAVVAFNHLFAGADAFVAAQLWDMPVQFSAMPSRVGPMVMATLRF
jgi:hypothetical protein